MGYGMLILSSSSYLVPGHHVRHFTLPCTPARTHRLILKMLLHPFQVCLLLSCRTQACKHVHTHQRITCVSTYAHTQMCAHTHVDTHIYMLVYMYTCVCMHICMCICIYKMCLYTICKNSFIYLYNIWYLHMRKMSN